jgi:hypothetical protein
MNAPLKHPDVRSLDDLHRERAALLKEKAKIAMLRSKLGDCDAELEAAVEAATKFSEHEADLVEAWMDAGATSPRPVADFRQMQRLETKRMAAAAACDNARGARETLDAQDVRCDRELARLAGEIEAEAARCMGLSFGELGREAAELRQRLDAIGSELLAGRHYFKALAERSYDDTGKREAAYDYAERCATHGIVHLPSVDQAAFSAKSFPIADREKVKEVEARFRQLCEGELTHEKRI